MTRGRALYGTDNFLRSNATWRQSLSLVQAFDLIVREQASKIDACTQQRRLSRWCSATCRGQLSEDPWLTCPLPRLLPGLTSPLVRAWREALPDHGEKTLLVINVSDYRRDPVSLLERLFSFVGVSSRPATLQRIADLPTSNPGFNGTYRIIAEVDPPWQAVAEAQPLPETVAFLSEWYQKHEGSVGCWKWPVAEHQQEHSASAGHAKSIAIGSSSRAPTAPDFHGSTR